MKTYQPQGSNSLLITNHKTLQKVMIKNVVLLKLYHLVFAEW